MQTKSVSVVLDYLQESCTVEVALAEIQGHLNRTVYFGTSVLQIFIPVRLASPSASNCSFPLDATPASM